MESTTKYSSSSSLIHSKPPSLGATGKRNLISVLYLQHGANRKGGGIELFPRRLFRWMIRVKSRIITHSYSLPVTVNFENVPQFRTTPHPYAKAWFQSYGEKVMASNTGWGTGWPVSWASIKYWEFFEEGITPANRQGQRKMLNRSGVAIVDEPHSYLIHRSQSCENFQTVKTMYVIDGPVFLLNKADAFFRKNVLICNKNL